LSRDVPAVTGFLCDIAAVLREAMKQPVLTILRTSKKSGTVNIYVKETFFEQTNIGPKVTFYDQQNFSLNLARDFYTFCGK